MNESATIVPCPISFCLLTERKMENDSYSKQISRQPEGKKKMTAQGSGVLWLSTYLNTISATNK